MFYFYLQKQAYALSLSRNINQPTIDRDSNCLLMQIFILSVVLCLKQGQQVINLKQCNYDSQVAALRNEIRLNKSVQKCTKKVIVIDYYSRAIRQYFQYIVYTIDKIEMSKSSECKYDCSFKRISFDSLQESRQNRRLF